LWATASQLETSLISRFRQKLWEILQPESFISTRYHGQSNWLVSARDKRHFSDRPLVHVNGSQLDLYILGLATGSTPFLHQQRNNIAFGLDPDCHFFNDGVKLTVMLPDTGNTCALLGLAMGMIVLVRSRLIRR
jgi:hypothetical protein